MLNNPESGPIGLIFIPHWLEQALKDNNKPLSTILNIDELRTFITLDDLAKFFYINRRLYNSNLELPTALKGDFQFIGTSPYSLNNSNSYHDFKFLNDIDIAIDLIQINSNSNTDIVPSVKSNFLYDLQEWELPLLICRDEINSIKNYGLFSLNTVALSNNVYGITFSTEVGEDSEDYRTYVSLDNLMNLVSKYFDFRYIVRLKAFKTFLKYMDYVN